MLRGSCLVLANPLDLRRYPKGKSHVRRDYPVGGFDFRAVSATLETYHPSTPRNKYAQSMSNIHDQIDQERQAARAACEINGANSAECAAAWDAVEELQAEASHQRTKEAPKNAFQQYCDANPDADECRVYDN